MGSRASQTPYRAVSNQKQPIKKSTPWTHNNYDFLDMGSPVMLSERICKGSGVRRLRKVANPSQSSSFFQRGCQGSRLFTLKDQGWGLGAQGLRNGSESFAILPPDLRKLSHGSISLLRCGMYPVCPVTSSCSGCGVLLFLLLLCVFVFSLVVYIR